MKRTRFVQGAECEQGRVPGGDGRHQEVVALQEQRGRDRIRPAHPPQGSHLHRDKIQLINNETCSISPYV